MFFYHLGNLLKMQYSGPCLRAFHSSSLSWGPTNLRFQEHMKLGVFFFNAYIVTYLYSLYQIKWGSSLVFPNYHWFNNLFFLCHSLLCCKHPLAWFSHFRLCLIFYIHGQRHSQGNWPSEFLQLLSMEIHLRAPGWLSWLRDCLGLRSPPSGPGF